MLEENPNVWAKKRWRRGNGSGDDFHISNIPEKSDKGKAVSTSERNSLIAGNAIRISAFWVTDGSRCREKA